MTSIGKTDSYKSAGDLSFYNGGLVLAGYTDSLGNTTKETLVGLNSTMSAVVARAALDLVNPFGLATINKTEPYGFAQTSIYRINPAEKTESKRTVKLEDCKSSRLANVNGAAYVGDI